MYIPYEKIGAFINKFVTHEVVKDLFYNLKVSQNVSYIKSNKPKVLRKIRTKLLKSEKVNVVFYVYDETKWKCQSLYDLLNGDERFDVKILVTKNAASNIENPSYQSSEDVLRVYNFFKTRNLKVELAYDIASKSFIPFKNFNPDIIFYQHPWYVETVQGPVVCSEFALTAYIPYYFPIEVSVIDVDLRFHKYVENYFVLNEYTKAKYENKLNRKIENLRPVGYPYLDNYRESNNSECNYVIYAPHWTVAGIGLAFSTFEWSGKFMLEYAKTHSEINWVFKPHPMLYKALIDNKLMTIAEANEYYNAWESIGIKYESGEYLDLFSKSSMMVTDSSSFLGEYLITEKPLIHMLSEKSSFRYSDNPILKTCYRVENLEDLKSALNEIPQNDYKRVSRLETLKNMKIKDTYAAQNILTTILNEVE